MATENTTTPTDETSAGCVVPASAPTAPTMDDDQIGRARVLFAEEAYDANSGQQYLDF